MPIKALICLIFVMWYNSPQQNSSCEYGQNINEITTLKEMNLSKQEQFIGRMSTAVINSCKGTGLFPSVKMAQLCLETGYGKHFINNNGFGIKATGKHTPFWTGEAVTKDTIENFGNGDVKIKDGFRAYKTVEDGIKDHTFLLQNNKRYAPVFTATTPKEQAELIRSCGYCTDPDYVKKLMWIINTFNLTCLDEAKY